MVEGEEAERDDRNRPLQLPRCGGCVNHGGTASTARAFAGPFLSSLLPHFVHFGVLPCQLFQKEIHCAVFMLFIQGGAEGTSEL